MKLLGRNAIVTGASRGLGKAIARAFLSEGASVLMGARDETTLRSTCRELDLERRPEQQLLAVAADVSRESDVQRLITTAIESLGQIHIVVNNAGVYGPMGCLEDVSWPEWIKAIEINLYGTVMVCRQVLPHLKHAKYGKIINLSGGGATAPLPRISAYAASKAAVIRLTETIAEEVRDFNIDVNAIAPGALNTRLMDEVIAAGPQKVGEEFYRRTLKQKEDGGTSLERSASLAVFLASAASDHITGKLISAVWDPWEKLPDYREALAKSDVYTLRRIVPRDRGQTWG